MPKDRICLIEGCGKKHVGKGYCNIHYRRLKRHGDPLAFKRRVMTAPGELIKFLKEIALPYQGSDCLIWPFGKDGKGRGVIHIDGRQHQAHRWVCENTHGLPPHASYEARHLCGNGHKGCVSPIHIVWGTRLENIADRKKHGRDLYGSKNHNSKLSIEDVRFIRLNAGTLKRRDLANKFGVTVHLIGLIQRNLIWKWLNDSNS